MILRKLYKGEELKGRYEHSGEKSGDIMTAIFFSSGIFANNSQTM